MKKNVTRLFFCFCSSWKLSNEIWMWNSIGFHQAILLNEIRTNVVRFEIQFWAFNLTFWINMIFLLRFVSNSSQIGMQCVSRYIANRIEWLNVSYEMNEASQEHKHMICVKALLRWWTKKNIVKILWRYVSLNWKHQLFNVRIRIRMAVVTITMASCIFSSATSSNSDDWTLKSNNAMRPEE